MQVLVYFNDCEAARTTHGATRAQIARILWDLRKRGARIWKTPDGYAADSVAYYI